MIDFKRPAPPPPPPRLLFGYYDNRSEPVPSKHIGIKALSEMAKSPTVATNGIHPAIATEEQRAALKAKAPLITPFNGNAKIKEVAELAQFAACVVDHDHDNRSEAGIRQLYASLEVSYMAFTTSSHTDDVQRWKVPVPYSRPCTADEHLKIAKGIAQYLKADSNQANIQQGFYAPYKLTGDAPYACIDELDAYPPLDIDDVTHPFMVAAMSGYAELMAIKGAKQQPDNSDHNGDGAHPDWNGYTDDNELIEAARKMKPNGGRMFTDAWFADLFDGNTEALCRVYPADNDVGYDRSSADWKLACLFVFLVGPDPERIERLMRMSALQRPKWDRHDYLAGTIDKALRATTTFYDKDYKRPSEAPAVPVRLYADVLADAQLLDGSSLSDIESLVLESASLNAIERDAVWKVIKKQTGTSLGVMRQIVKESEEKNDDHLVYAKSVIEHMGRDNVLSALSDVWHWDNSGVWRKCEERTVKSWSQGTLGGRTVVTKGLIDSVTDLFKTEVFQPNHRFDVGGDECVNTLNGEVSLTNGVWTLQPHKREHYRTTQVPVVFDPLATAPRFAQFLREVFLGEDGEQQAQALLEMMGYSLMAHCKHEKFIICIGNGANGKSVVLKLLEDLCGIESVAGVQPSQFANTFQRAHLQNKLVNIVTEIEQGAVIDDAALKGITSGETTTVEHKFGAPFQLTPFATCWFGANHMPHTRDFSDGLFRRAVILKFDAVFKPEFGNCDPFLGAKLKAELSGILTMALNAYSAALVNGFTTPSSSAQAKNEWRLEADQVAQFIDAVCVASRGDEVQASVLYGSYKTWADGNGIRRSLSMKSFRERLTRLGFGKRDGRDCNYVTGVKFTGGVAQFPVLVSTRG